MNNSADQRRPFGKLELTIPPIIFGTAAFRNVPQVIPEQRKLEICGRWFQHVKPPVLINAAYRRNDSLSLELLARMLRRLDVSADDVAIHLTLEAPQFPEGWEKSCQLLGDDYRPKLVSIVDPNEAAWQMATELKVGGTVLGTGVATTSLDGMNSLTPPADWILLTAGFTLMRHPATVLASMTKLAAQQIPIVVSGIFEEGFLVGHTHLDGRVPSAVDPADRSVLAWRTSFAALCHGHGVLPAHACIQFALSGPGVVAVVLNSSHPDHVDENMRSAQQPVPDIFWASMKEEGLLELDNPIAGFRP